jgi:hypothetical protein
MGLAKDVVRAFHAQYGEAGLTRRDTVSETPVTYVVDIESELYRIGGYVRAAGMIVADKMIGPEDIVRAMMLGILRRFGGLVRSGAAAGCYLQTLVVLMDTPGVPNLAKRGEAERRLTYDKAYRNDGEMLADQIDTSDSAVLAIPSSLMASSKDWNRCYRVAQVKHAVREAVRRAIVPFLTASFGELHRPGVRLESAYAWVDDRVLRVHSETELVGVYGESYDPIEADHKAPAIVRLLHDRSDCDPAGATLIHVNDSDLYVTMFSHYAMPHYERVVMHTPSERVASPWLRPSVVIGALHAAALLREEPVVPVDASVLPLDALVASLCAILVSGGCDYTVRRIPGTTKSTGKVMSGLTVPRLLESWTASPVSLVGPHYHSATHVPIVDQARFEGLIVAACERTAFRRRVARARIPSSVPVAHVISSVLSIMWLGDTSAAVPLDLFTGLKL